jgi:hypothetical protein
MKSVCPHMRSRRVAVFAKCNDVARASSRLDHFTTMSVTCTKNDFLNKRHLFPHTATLPAQNSLITELTNLLRCRLQLKATGRRNYASIMSRYSFSKIPTTLPPTVKEPPTDKEPIQQQVEQETPKRVTTKEMLSHSTETKWFSKEKLRLPGAEVKYGKVEEVVQPESPHSLHVAMIGAPNAGKSTLINSIVGHKVTIVSPRAQTTREQTVGIFSSKNYQVVFQDTPGIIPIENSKEIQREIVTAAWSTIDACDLGSFPSPLSSSDAIKCCSSWMQRRGQMQRFQELWKDS